jgi:hypothetical protein
MISFANLSIELQRNAARPGKPDAGEGVRACCPDLMPLPRWRGYHLQFSAAIRTKRQNPKKRKRNLKIRSFPG